METKHSKGLVHKKQHTHTLATANNKQTDPVLGHTNFKTTVAG